MPDQSQSSEAIRELTRGAVVPAVSLATVIILIAAIRFIDRPPVSAVPDRAAPAAKPFLPCDCPCYACRVHRSRQLGEAAGDAIGDAGFAEAP